MVLAEFTLGEVFLSVLYIFMFVIWFWLLISIFGDLFSDHEESGWSKALWTIFVIFMPFLGILVYLIVRGKGMAERAMKRQQEAQKQFDQYVRETAGSSGGGGDATAEIERAHNLLEKG